MAQLATVERQYLLRKVSGATAQTPIGQLRRQYYIQVLGSTGTPQMPYKQLYLSWLRAEIAAQGGTPPTTNLSDSNLWRILVSAIGKTPSNRITDNQLTFYGNAA